MQAKRNRHPVSAIVATDKVSTIATPTTLSRRQAEPETRP